MKRILITCIRGLMGYRHLTATEKSGVQSWLRPGFFVEVFHILTMKCQKQTDGRRTFQLESMIEGEKEEKRERERDRKGERERETGRERERERKNKKIMWWNSYTSIKKQKNKKNKQTNKQMRRFRGARRAAIHNILRSGNII